MDFEDLETVRLEVVRGFGDEQGAKPIGELEQNLGPKMTTVVLLC